MLRKHWTHFTHISVDQQKIRLIRGYKRSQHLEIFDVRARIVVWSLENKSSVFEFWMTGDTAECVGADMTFPDMPMPIDAGVVSRA